MSLAFPELTFLHQAAFILLVLSWESLCGSILDIKESSQYIPPQGANQMSVIQVRHIRNHLEKLFTGKVDMSDVAKQTQDEQKKIFLSRSLAAYTLVDLCKISSDAAAKYITDGFDDNGIDAIYFDQAEKIAYFVQSKWDFDGNGFPEMGGINAFVKGFKDLIALEWGRFNAKLLKHQGDIETALDDAGVTYELILTHTGQQNISRHAKEVFEDLLKEINDVSEVVRYKIISQAELHASISGSADGSPINLEVMLYDWGIIQEPYLAYYGQVEAKDVASWWQQHGSGILSKNLRKLITKSDVNDSINETLKKTPEHFWYYNNGITALCSKVSRKLIGGSDRKSGSFECEGVSVVNGAQTVGTIGSTQAAGIEKARVAVRFISLEKCPEDFATSVTRATNTQNRVERRDFVALDPQQERIRKELYLELGKTYSFKTGENDPSVDSGCSITEATTALACAQPDLNLAVLAKREVGKLWENLDKPPYKILFNGGLTALKMWRLIEIQRVVENALKPVKGGASGKTAYHGNLLIEHLVFKRLEVNQFNDSTLDFDAVKARADTLAKELLGKVSAKTNALYPGSLLTYLFRNASKVKAIADGIVADEAAAAIAAAPAATAPVAPATSAALPASSAAPETPVDEEIE